MINLTRVTTYESKEAAQAAADEFNAKFTGATYAVTFVPQQLASFMKVPRGGYYVVNPWGKFV